jgi:hypothetical protein
MQPVQWSVRRSGWLLAVVGMAIASFAAVRGAGHPDFSGNWQADLKTSDFGAMGQPDRMVMNVTHKEPEVTIHSDLVMAGASRAWDVTCKTDGKECKSTNNDVTLSLQWHDDSLLLNRAFTVQGYAIKVHETWVLSPDGKTLTSSRTVETDQGNGTQKVIFTKQ